MWTKSHWENVYRTRALTETSWYQAQALRSFDLIERTRVARDAAIIDVGGGASTLADDLLARGYGDVTVLDIASTALAAAKARLGARAANVRWIEADVAEARLPPQRFDVWHDRAVFHFLTTPDARQNYISRALRATKPHGWLVIATFAEDGPERCSGLPAVRYNASALHAQFGDAVTLVHYEREAHHTPTGKVQSFGFALFQKRLSV